MTGPGMKRAGCSASGARQSGFEDLIQLPFDPIQSLLNSGKSLADALESLFYCIEADVDSLAHPIHFCIKSPSLLAQPPLKLFHQLFNVPLIEQPAI